MSATNDHDTLPPSQDPTEPGGTIEPPTSFLGIVKRLGPGLIIAGSIVGSGELIATTKTGAQAGISLLWLIVIGCLIKVFVQIELGRYTIANGETTLSALNRVPGPRFRVNWILWFWLFTVIVTIGQLGGIIGGVGQALALACPIQGDYRDAIRMPSADSIEKYLAYDDILLSEWNLKQARRWGDSPEAIEEETDLTPEQADWVRAAVAEVQSRDRSLPSDTVENVAKQIANESLDDSALRRRFLDSTKDVHSLDEALTLLLDAEEAMSKAEQDRDATRYHYAVSRFLHGLITEKNLQWIHSREIEDRPDDDPVNDLRGMSDRQQRRLLKGHQILSGELAATDREQHRATVAVVAVEQLLQARARLEQAEESKDADRQSRAQEDVAAAQAEVNRLIEPYTKDDKLWSAFIALITIALLYRGRYGMIQNISTVLVVGFTFITIGNVISLQNELQWRISTNEIIRGLSFQLPEAVAGIKPLATALATFGIIGVGATELIAYPYWCLEKGYAKFTGPSGPDENWARRARGWLRVMRYDAFASMCVYTLATLAFFLMGVAVLYNEGRDPDGMRMVSTLAQAYVPVFGTYAKWLFLVGAVAVLYSTFMVANAGNARMLTDGLKVFGLMDRHSERVHNRSVSALSVILPLMCLAVYLVPGSNPVALVIVAGATQATLLPMIGIGAVYLRYTRTDSRLKPSRLWDLCLILSSIGLLVAGSYGVYKQLF